MKKNPAFENDNLRFLHFWNHRVFFSLVQPGGDGPPLQHPLPRHRGPLRADGAEPVQNHAHLRELFLFLSTISNKTIFKGGNKSKFFEGFSQVPLFSNKKLNLKKTKIKKINNKFKINK